MEKRIRKQFTKELENIKKRILALGALVEERVQMAVKAIDTNDWDLAQQIIKTDYEIDETDSFICNRNSNHRECDCSDYD